MKFYLNLVDDGGVNTVETIILPEENSHFIHEYGVYEVGNFNINSESEILIDCERKDKFFYDIIILINNEFKQVDFKFKKGILYIYDYDGSFFECKEFYFILDRYKKKFEYINDQLIIIK